MPKTKTEELLFEKIFQGEKAVDRFREDVNTQCRHQQSINKDLFKKFNKIQKNIFDLKIEILERLHKLEKRVAIIAVTVSFIMSMLGPFLFKLIEKHL
jgi:hypothetical protein